MRFGCTYRISGNGTNHLLAQFGGEISPGLCSVTVVGTPAFSAAFAQAEDCGILADGGTVYTGGATGKRYSSIKNGAIDTFGGGANYYPGDVAGTTDGFGVYN